MKTLKRKSLPLVTALMLVLSMFAMLPAGTFRASALEGSGTKNDPYIIMTYADLYRFIGSSTRNLNSLGSEEYFKLGNDVYSEDSKTDYYFNLTADYSRTVYIDLAGHTLSRIVRSSDDKLFYVGENCTLVISDSKGGGEVHTTKNQTGQFNMFIVTNGGTLRINGGSFIDYSPFMHHKNTLYFCQVISTLDSKTASGSCTVEINDGYFESEIWLIRHSFGSLTINGGIFSQRSDVDGMSGRFDGIIMYSENYYIRNCMLTGNVSVTEISGSKLKSHMPSDVKIISDGNTVSLKDKTDIIKGVKITVYTPEGIKGMKWNGNTLSWNKYVNASKYGLQVEKRGLSETQFKVVDPILYSSANSYDLTSFFKTNGVGEYRVLMGAETDSGMLLSKVTYSSTVTYDPRQAVSSAAVIVAVPRDGNLPGEPRINTGGLLIQNGIWYKGASINGEKMSGTEKFIAGQKYTLYVILDTDSDHKFASGMTGTVNGNTATTAGFAGSVFLIYTFTALPDNTLHQVNITVKEPKAGAIISDNCGVLSVTPSDMGVNVYNNSSAKNKVSWTDPPYMIQTGVTKFTASKTYTLNFKLAQSYSLSEGAPKYELSEKTVVKVNGKTAEYAGRNGIYYTYKLKFTVPEGLKGDVDGNGSVNMKDLTTLQRYVNGWNVTINEANADLDGNGSVNMKDVAALQKLINSL